MSGDSGRRPPAAPAEKPTDLRASDCLALGARAGDDGVRQGLGQSAPGPPMCGTSLILAGSCIKACAKAPARRAKRRKKREEMHIMQFEHAPNTNFAIYFTKRREKNLHCRTKVIYNLLKARGGRRHPERR